MPTKTQLEESLNVANDKITELEKKISSFGNPGKEKKERKPRKAGAYALFVKAQFAGIKQANEGKTAPEIMKLISLKWKEEKAAKEISN